MSATHEKVDAAKERLEAALVAITTSAQFTEYLRLKARFHQYSFGNVALILAQRPSATQVAGFRKWLELGRAVKKGEKGIAILVPLRYRRTDDETGDVVSGIRGFGIGYVFDVAQTEGKELPQPVRPVDSVGDEALAEMIHTRVVATCAARGIAYRVENIAETRGSDARGYWLPDSRVIATDHDLSPVMRAKTDCHELAHALCAHGGDDDRQDAETVAEAAAFVALAQMGLDTLGYTAPYVAGWAGNVERFRAALGAIDRTAKEILAVIGG